jgi:RNA polymerase sigma factor (sigma-70 family)
MDAIPSGTSSLAATGSVTLCYAQLRAGDDQAACELWKRFFPRIRGLARKTLGAFPQRASDADDAAQNAFVSFFQQVERGDFGDHLDRQSLWNLLAVITVRKALKQVERERSQKRGGGRIRSETERAASADGREFRLDEALAEMPMQEFDLRCEEMLLMLPEQLREIAMLRLMGHTNVEIAGLLQCTERRIQRKLQHIRARWEHALDG